MCKNIHELSYLSRIFSLQYLTLLGVSDQMHYKTHTPFGTITHVSDTSNFANSTSIAEK